MQFQRAWGSHLGSQGDILQNESAAILSRLITMKMARPLSGRNWSSVAACLAGMLNIALANNGFLPLVF